MCCLIITKILTLSCAFPTGAFLAWASLHRNTDVNLMEQTPCLRKREKKWLKIFLCWVLYPAESPIFWASHEADTEGRVSGQCLCVCHYSLMPQPSGLFPGNLCTHTAWLLAALTPTLINLTSGANLRQPI